VKTATLAFTESFGRLAGIAMASVGALFVSGVVSPELIAPVDEVSCESILAAQHVETIVVPLQCVVCHRENLGKTMWAVKHGVLKLKGRTKQLTAKITKNKKITVILGVSP
jgi:hypothetical protein